MLQGKGITDSARSFPSSTVRHASGKGYHTPSNGTVKHRFSTSYKLSKRIRFATYPSREVREATHLDPSSAMISVVVVLLLCFAKASFAAYLVMRDPAIAAAMAGLLEKLWNVERVSGRCLGLIRCMYSEQKASSQV